MNICLHVKEPNVMIQTESNSASNVKPETILSDLNVLIQCNKYEEECSKSSTVEHESNIQSSLPEWVQELENTVATQTIEEKNIDNEIVSLHKENKQLKEELSKMKKIAERMFRENKVLRDSNKKIYKKLETFKNVKKKTTEEMSNIFYKNKLKAVGRRVNEKLWEPETLRQALILKVKCGSSGYNEVRKHFPLPTLRTLQRRIKHIEFRPGTFEEVFNYLADEVPHHREEWKDCALVFDEMSIKSEEIMDSNTKEFIDKI